MECYMLLFQALFLFSLILVILDSNGNDCQNVNFNIGPSTTSTRSWTIRVTQYTCQEEDVGGPPGCLQYYTQIAANFQRYWSDSH